MAESSSFDVDLESTALKKPYVHHHRRRRLVVPVIAFFAVAFVLLRLFGTAAPGGDTSATIANSIINGASEIAYSGQNEGPESAEAEVDDVISKNRKAAAAAAANIKYEDGHAKSRTKNGNLNGNLLADDKARPVVQASKEMADNQLKDDAPEGGSAGKKVTPKGPGASKNKDYSIYSTYDSKDDYGKSGFDPSAEFKAIVALSPVVVFTWDKSNVLIPKDSSSSSSSSSTLSSESSENTAAVLSKDDSSSRKVKRDESSHHTSSRNLLKTLWEHYQITPVPTYVALDRHPHFKELAIYINELYHKLNNNENENYNLFGTKVASKKKDSASNSKPKSRAESLLNENESTNNNNGNKNDDTNNNEKHSENENGSSNNQKRLVEERKNIYGLPELEEGENILPGIVIAGKPIGNARQFKAAHDSGDLLSILKELGDGIINVERAV